MSFQIKNISFEKAQINLASQDAGSAIEGIYSKWEVSSLKKNDKITLFVTAFFANNNQGVFKQGSDLYYNITELDSSFGKKTLKKNTVSVVTLNLEDPQGYCFSSKNIVRWPKSETSEKLALANVIDLIQKILQDHLEKHSDTVK
ncbi:MAG: hypothetical protein WCT85_01585 [Parachlamydiales bacterium]